MKLHEFGPDDADSESEWFINESFDLKYDLCSSGSYVDDADVIMRKQLSCTICHHSTCPFSWHMWNNILIMLPVLTLWCQHKGTSCP